MPTDEMVEKVAGAIWETWCKSEIAPEHMADFTWEELCNLAAKYPDNAPGKFKAVALDEARAALAAMTGAEQYAGKPPKADPNAVVEALEFYADEKRWEAFSDDERAAYASHNFGSELGDDKGQKARDALQSMAKAKVAE